MANTANTTAKKTVKATDLNIWVLARMADGRVEFPNRIEPTSATHMRRCLKAGLVEVVSRQTLRITTAGIVEIQAYNVRQSAYPHGRVLQVPAVAS